MSHTTLEARFEITFEVSVLLEKIQYLPTMKYVCLFQIISIVYSFDLLYSGTQQESRFFSKLVCKVLSTAYNIKLAVFNTNYGSGQKKVCVSYSYNDCCMIRFVLNVRIKSLRA